MEDKLKVLRIMPGKAPEEVEIERIERTSGTGWRLYRADFPL